MASVREHYDNHLGKFYTWMLGDFIKQKDDFKHFCIHHGIRPATNARAADLGCGNGVQTIALAELGFSVIAIDFNKKLLEDLHHHAGKLPLEIIEADFRQFPAYLHGGLELIVCGGDTLTHLVSFDEIHKLIQDAYVKLSVKGKIVLTFRDYSRELTDVDRFIPVRNDTNRILTCFLEYFSDSVRVTDLLHERVDGEWTQKISSYHKLRLTDNFVLDSLVQAGFKIFTHTTWNGFSALIAGKA